MMNELYSDPMWAKQGVTETEYMEKLDIPGAVIVEADKGLGMSILSLDVMKKADKTLLAQMGAKHQDLSVEQVIVVVESQIKRFESNLNFQQTEFLKLVFPVRGVHPSYIKIPFLRSMHKIHKMTDEDIEKKKIDDLKFRFEQFRDISMVSNVFC